MSECNNLVEDTDSQCHEINDNDDDNKRNENYSVDKENQEDIEKIISPLSVHVRNENDSVTGSPNRPRHEKLKLEEINSDPDQSPKKCIINFGGQLSDVSDIESDEEDIDEDEKPKMKCDNENQLEEDTVNFNVEKEDLLDFEAEDGECSGKEENKIFSSPKENEMPVKKAEKEGEELEEGELADDDETKVETNEPRLICRFYNRGQCTWGSNCRFIHVGVTDKDNYSMFDFVRTLPPTALPPQPHPSVLYPLYPSTIPIADRLSTIPATTAARKEEPAESAWERGLRQAKKKSSKRKPEIDFEDRNINLMLGQEEINKENDYYSRHSSPSRTLRSDNWKESGHKAGHNSVEHYPAEYIPHPEASTLPYYPSMHHGITRTDYWNLHRLGGLPYDEYVRTAQTSYGQDYYDGRRYVHSNAYYAKTGMMHPLTNTPFQSDYCDRKQNFKQYSGSSAREVIVQKNDKSYKDIRTERFRGDEWADPWMRSRSPVGRGRRYEKMHSSKSSYSSNSESSRSSSRSSYSSNSKNSKSASRSSGSRSPSCFSSPSNSRKRTPIQFKLSPSSRMQLPRTRKVVPKPVAPILSMDKRIISEKQMPPLVTSPKIKRPFSPLIMASNTVTALPPVGIPTKPPTPPPISMKTKNVVTKLPPRNEGISGAPVRISQSKSKSSSRSSSESFSSSDSSSESSGSSDSESSSSKSSSSPEDRHPKRIPVNESIQMQKLKEKSMDALKLSGQKQQIRLTLRGSANGSLNPALKRSPLDTSDLRRNRPQPSRKRHDISPESNSDSDKSARQGSNGVPSRRGELLKQLKAVEDAIARKRSKIT